MKLILSMSLLAIPLVINAMDNERINNIVKKMLAINQQKKESHYTELVELALQHKKIDKLIILDCQNETTINNPSTKNFNLVYTCSTKPAFAPLLQELLNRKTFNANCQWHCQGQGQCITDAAYKQAYDNCMILLKANADPNVAGQSLESEQNDELSPLLIAIDHADPILLYLFLSHKADPNKVYKDICLPLSRAIQNYHYAAEEKDTLICMMKTLLIHGADPYQKDSVVLGRFAGLNPNISGQNEPATPLKVAQAYDQNEIKDLLVYYYEKVNETTGIKERE